MLEHKPECLGMTSADLPHDTEMIQETGSLLYLQVTPAQSGCSCIWSRGIVPCHRQSLISEL